MASEPNSATPRLSRRAALKSIGVTAGAAAFLPLLSREGLLAFSELQKQGAAPALRVLGARQFAALEALAEAIIPADERSPGAKEARVPEYIDLLLSETEEEQQRPWLEGLAAVDAQAEARFGAPLARLSAERMEALLTELSKHEAAPQTPLEKFFKTTKDATIRGYYTSEIGIHKELRYQGNRTMLEFVGCETEDGKDCPHCGQKAVR